MGVSTTPTRVARLVSTTYDHFAAAESLLRSLKWAEFGKEVAAVKPGSRNSETSHRSGRIPFLLWLPATIAHPRRGGGDSCPTSP